MSPQPASYPQQLPLAAGASVEQIMEALGVAVLMGGGPSVIYATHVVEALEQVSAEGATAPRSQEVLITATPG